MNDQLHADESAPRTTWRCMACSRLNRPGVTICAACGAEYGSSVPPETAPPLAGRLITATSSPYPAPPDPAGLFPAANTAEVRDVNPLLSIWTKPRATMRHIVSTDPLKYFYVLLILGAFFRTLDRASGRSMGDRAPIWLIFVLSIVFAPLAVPLSHLAAIFGRWVGAKLGGVATREQVRATFAWAAVPGIAGSLLFWPIQLTLFGGDMFRTETPLMDGANPFLVLGVLVGPLVPAIWSVVTAVQVYAEVHQFSAWRSIGAGLLGVVIILGPIVALAVAVLMLVPGR